MFPIPKIDNPIKEKHFRPIYILPVLSKVYEKVILYQINDYIEKSSVYNLTQSGFCKSHLTQTSLLKFRDDIQKALNGNEITMSVMIHYSKAFDTIDHESFIRKLISLNFRYSSMQIILSYLTNRKQYVQVNHNPQGYQYTLESHKAVSWARFYSTSMLQNYQLALNQIQFSMQMILKYTK